VREREVRGDIVEISEEGIVSFIMCEVE
jgi:hypothetical protein